MNRKPWVLVVALVAVAHPTLPGPPESAESAETESPPHTLRESIEPAVEAYLRENPLPCAREREEGIPCFPASVDAVTPVYSVADAIRDWKPDDGPTGPAPETTLAGSAVAGVGFDPVCAAKSLFKKIRGRNDTYYLYRVWTAAGEGALLREQPMEPATQPTTVLGYVLVKKIDGQCAAVAAWQQANREALARNRGRE